MSLPFNIHWKAGVVPPLVNAQYMVTSLSWQIILSGLGMINTLALVVGTIVILILLLFTIAGNGHFSLLTISHSTTSPSFRDGTQSVSAPGPISTPFIAHWYTGCAPPLVLADLKIFSLPEHHDVPLSEVIEIVGVT